MVSESRDGIRIFRLSGQLLSFHPGGDLPRLESAVRVGLRKGERRFLFDLGAVDYIDEAALDLMWALSARVRERGGEVRWSGLRDHLARCVRRSGVDRRVHVHTSEAEAIAASLGG